MKKENEFIKFEKIITVNEVYFIDEEFILHQKLINMLLMCMKETNDKHNVHTEYFTLRLIDSEKNPFAKDLKFEWVTLKN